jgi:hypothetical protein
MRDLLTIVGIEARGFEITVVPLLHATVGHLMGWDVSVRHAGDQRPLYHHVIHATDIHLDDAVRDALYLAATVFIQRSAAALKPEEK